MGTSTRCGPRRRLAPTSLVARERLRDNPRDQGMAHVEAVVTPPVSDARRATVLPDHNASLASSERLVTRATRPPRPVSGPSAAGQGFAAPLRALDRLPPTQQPAAMGRPPTCGQDRASESVNIAKQIAHSKVAAEPKAAPACGPGLSHRGQSSIEYVSPSSVRRIGITRC